MLESARSGAREVLASHKQVTGALRDALLEHDELVDDEITRVVTGAQGSVFGSDYGQDKSMDTRLVAPGVVPS